MAAGVNSGIPGFYVQQFANTVQLKLQQQGSVLRQAVMSGNHLGNAASPVEQFGAINANKVTGRFTPIEQIDAPTDRRWVYPADYEVPQLLSKEDLLRMIIDPKSAMTENAVNAIGRSADQEILNGLLGANNTGTTQQNSVTLPSTQIVSVQQGAASPTNLTVAKLRMAKRILMANYVQLDRDPVYAAINAANHDALLAETQVTSMDFNDRPVLVEGRIVRFLGINLIHTELLGTGTDDQSGTSTMTPVWAKSGAYFGVWNDIGAKVNERPDLTGIPWQVYVNATFGGTRLEEKKVVQIWTR